MMPAPAPALVVTSLTAALWLLPAAEPRAELSIRIGSGFAASHDHRDRHGPRHRDRHHRPRYSHGVPFTSRGHVPHRTAPHRDRVQRSHGVPFVSREHRGPPHRRHPRHDRRHAPRVLGHRDRHVLGAGCRPHTRRSYDRYGRLIIEHLSVCYDRYGRGHVIGGSRHR